MPVVWTKTLMITREFVCGGVLTGDQISKFLVPGTHMSKSIYVTAPKGASILRLYDGPRGDGWTGDIPPAGVSSRI